MAAARVAAWRPLLQNLGPLDGRRIFSACRYRPPHV